MDSIYEYIGLTKENTLDNLTVLEKLLFLNRKYSADDILRFYILHEKRDDCIVFNKECIISLTEIFLESEFSDVIIPFVNNFLNANVIKFYIQNFKKLKIEKFVNSKTYKMIIQGQFNMKEIKNNVAFYKLLIKIINQYNDKIDNFKLIKLLSSEELKDILLNENTFIPILLYSDKNHISKILTYEIKTKDEYCNLYEKLKDEEFSNGVKNYILSQNIINDIILCCSIIINDSLFFNLEVKNINIKKIISIAGKENIFQFGNLYFKKLLFEFNLSQEFDIEYFVFSITPFTMLENDVLKPLQNIDFSQDEIFYIYFQKKLDICRDKNMFKYDVKTLLENKFYDCDLLKKLFNFDIDFNLFNLEEIEILIKEDIDIEKLLIKYFYKIMNADIKINNNIYFQYRAIYDFLENNQVSCEKLPLLKNIEFLTGSQKDRLIRYYLDMYNINNLTEFLMKEENFSEENIEFLKNKIEKINSAFVKLILFLKYKSELQPNEYIIDTLLSKMTLEEKKLFSENCSNLYLLKKHFFRNDKNNLAFSQKSIEKFYKSCDNNLEIFEEIANTLVNPFFLKHFLSLLFKDKFHTVVVCKNINQMLMNFKYEKEIILMCIGYYINTILQNDFFQECEITLTRDFLNILYIYMKENGKDKEIFKYCEEIIFQLKMYSSFFDCEFLISNLKNL